MERLWNAIGRRPGAVIARGRAFVRNSAFLRRTRVTGAELLARAERGANELRGTLSSRRSGLDGRPFAGLERRLLLRLERVLERVGHGLRLRVQHLSPGRTRIAIEPDAVAAPEDAVLVDEPVPTGAMPRELEPVAPPVTAPSAPTGPVAAGSVAAGSVAAAPVAAAPTRAPAARASGKPKKTLRIALDSAATAQTAAVTSEPVPARARAAKAERPVARRGKADPKAPRAGKAVSARPAAKASHSGTKAGHEAARSGDGATTGSNGNGKATTRWVGKPSDVPVEDLAKLPVKQLLARIPTLDDASCRALLAHERRTKKRKKVVDALAARLPS